MKKSRLIFAAVLTLSISAVPIAYTVNARTGTARSNGLSDDLAFMGAVIQLVEHNYVHPIGENELTQDALKGMMMRLDPHSDYMDEQEFQQTQSDISGKFGGLGIQISEQNGVPNVISPIEGTPAAKAGVQPGDLIVGIDGETTQGVSLDKIVRQLRGKPGTAVTITLLRGKEKPFDVTITRNIIQVATVKSKLEPNNIGYMRVTEFGEDTPADFKKSIADLKRQAGGVLKGLVLDVRNDPGGLLTSAVSIASNFLDGGTVVSIRGRRTGEDQTFKASVAGTLVSQETPIVVLINGASASASEIVAGALQDRNRAAVMGTQSFGKGSVQTIIPLNGHGALRMTTALYYTPNGRSIQGKGITPTILVEAPKEQQVSGGILLRESSLRGAFANPGALGTSADKSTSKKPSDADNAKADLSPPIKFDLIGTESDAQLKAALAYLDKAQSLQTRENATR
jgi:carboxyl-terminal processing protease